jgi:hypothetical protein
MQWTAHRRREERRSWSKITITLSAKAREILDYVRNAQDSSAGEAIDYLILKSETRELRLKAVSGIMVFDVEDDGPPITNEDVQRVLDEEYVSPKNTQKPTARRTSVAISPEAVAIVKRIRETHEVTFCKAVSDLIELPK